MVTLSSILVWKIPGTEEPGKLQSIGLKESDMTEQLSTHTDNSEMNTEVHKLRTLESLGEDEYNLVKKRNFVISTYDSLPLHYTTIHYYCIGQCS